MPNTAPDVPVTVAVAVIANDQNQVLLTQRAAHVHKGGCWEFPGGKQEPGETVFAALQREIGEELGLRVKQAQPLIEIPFHYPEKRVLLKVFRVTEYSGVPRGLEGQPLCWQAIDALGEVHFPEANRAIVHALQLPPSYLITPDPQALGTGRFLQQLENSLGKVSLLQLRAKSQSPDAYVALAEQVLPLCRKAGVDLLLNADATLVSAIGARGVHLSSERLMSCRLRPLSDDYWVAASCHNREQLQHAQHIGADFVVLAPVLPTVSHPGATPLGWQMFASLVAGCPLPVYALGGMKPEHVPQVWQSGGQGIAAISGLWQD